MANDILSLSNSASDPLRAFELLGVTPDPWQAEVLRSAAHDIRLNCSRQAGKTMVAAALAIREALFVPRGSVLIISPSERQSNEVLRVVNQGLDSLRLRFKTRTSTDVDIEGAGPRRLAPLPRRHHARLHGQLADHRRGGPGAG